MNCVHVPDNGSVPWGSILVVRVKLLCMCVSHACRACLISLQTPRMSAKCCVVYPNNGLYVDKTIHAQTTVSLSIWFGRANSVDRLTTRNTDNIECGLWGGSCDSKRLQAKCTRYLTKYTHNSCKSKECSVSYCPSCRQRIRVVLPVSKMLAMPLRVDGIGCSQQRLCVIGRVHAWSHQAARPENAIAQRLFPWIAWGET